MNSHPLAPLRAQDIARQIERGELSATAALRLGDEATAEREADLNIYSHRNPDTEPDKGPLAGIAVGVKDIFDTADALTCYGSPIYEDHVPAADAALVSMLRRAGGTIAGKTVTTEFAWFTPGATRNPHNHNHTPGGSSSGSAAGVAAGFFPAAIGSQTGGSVIRPASFCGVSGYKPSFRLFPTVGMKHFSWSLDTPGFFAATAADCAFVASAMSGRDLYVSGTDETPPRFGLLASTIDDLMSVDMREAVNHAAKRAKAWGAPVTNIEEPTAVAAAHAAHTPIQEFEARHALAFEAMNHRDLLSGPLRDYLDNCETVTPDAYDDARRIANRARKASRDLFDKCDVLIAPSSTGAAPEGLGFTGDSSFNRLWTLLGMPCVNVAGLADGTGLPLGIQIIAPFGQDAKALQAAHWLESRLAR
ncbi:amidase [Ahrensia sp. R2A130]|uniref:amidase n=1 Tax=Ahrensia sp. R2A130 TaxID=744979 RepID=UPI0001E0D0BD|nr:amidase [Ahrensia sp. R2A130]EFL90862.1 malonamidase E2 [Ahrensia sp. R2A130]